MRHSVQSCPSSGSPFGSPPVMSFLASNFSRGQTFIAIIFPVIESTWIVYEIKLSICIKLDFFNPEKQDLEAEERTSAQHHRHIDEAPNAAAPSIVQKPVNFPTSIRKRSIPYGKVTADGIYSMSFNNSVDQILPNFHPPPTVGFFPVLRPEIDSYFYI